MENLDKWVERHKRFTYIIPYWDKWISEWLDDYENDVYHVLNNLNMNQQWKLFLWCTLKYFCDWSSELRGCACLLCWLIMLITFLVYQRFREVGMGGWDNLRILWFYQPFTFHLRSPTWPIRNTLGIKHDSWFQDKFPCCKTCCYHSSSHLFDFWLSCAILQKFWAK